MQRPLRQASSAPSLTPECRTSTDRTAFSLAVETGADKTGAVVMDANGIEAVVAAVVVKDAIDTVADAIAEGCS